MLIPTVVAVLPGVGWERYADSRRSQQNSFQLRINEVSGSFLWNAGTLV
jgi:hypothetical protein